MRWIAPVILNLLFVSVDLMFDSVNRLVKGNQQIVVPNPSNEIVLVLGIESNLDVLERDVLQIDRDLNHGDSAEVVKQFFGLFLKLLLVFLT